MSRAANTPDVTFQAFTQFRNAGLASRKSLFQPEHDVWTPEVLLRLHAAFVGRFDEGTGDFFGKLRTQLRDLDDEALLLAAELLYVQQLFTTLTGGDKKRANVREILSWRSVQIELPHWAASALDHGLSADQSFNQHRPYHLAWLVEALLAWNALSSDQKEVSLRDPWAFRHFIQQVEGSRGYHQPVRKAVMYMVFPDTFEPISSRSDKAEIREAFLEDLGHPPTSNVDKDLLEIRDRLEARFGARFSYYTPELLARWRPTVLTSGALPSVSRNDVLAALRTFDAERRGRDEWNGWETNETYKYALEEGGRLYPAKEIVSIATGRPRTSFSGGAQTNEFLTQRDFRIVRLKRAGADPSLGGATEEQALSLVAVAEKVLTQRGLPMTVSELWSAIDTAGLYRSEHSDPQRALYSVLYRASADNEASRASRRPFVRVAPSTFGLVALGHVSDAIQRSEQAAQPRVPSKREIIEALKRDELQSAVAFYELETEDRRVRENLVDALVRAKKVRVADILADLSRDRLKDICIELELDSTGREKQPLINRILGEPEHDDYESVETKAGSQGALAVETLTQLLGEKLRIIDVADGWPAAGSLQFDNRSFDVSVYVRAISGSARNNPLERRFQNPSQQRPIADDPDRYELLLGLWTEQGMERAVIVAFDAYRRMDRTTRFSMFMPVSLLEQAADTGYATHENNRGETIYAFRPENFGRYFLPFIQDGMWQTSRREDDIPVKKRADVVAVQKAPKPIEDAINIRPQVGMYAAFSRLNYKPWFALAEFLDNSIQSFLSNRERLSDEGHAGPLVIDVNLDDTELSITDRAGGIAWGDFPRAFSPATPPDDTTGLSEFGLGMKAAACWFARQWTVRTSALGETVERTVSFDVLKISREGLESLPIESQPARESDHFTVITMRDLRVHPRGKTLAKIREHLKSIYRVLIKEGVVRIRLTMSGKTEELDYEPPELLHAPHHRFQGPSRLWRQEITVDLGDKKVTGWAGIMKSGAHSKAGFAVFRRNRLIEGSVGETYKPSPIFGSPNSFESQRIIGELFVHGFDVSHTKDGIQWGGHEDDIVEQVRRQLDSAEMPLIDQARGYRARRAAETLSKDFGKEALGSTADALAQPSTAEAVRSTPSLEVLEAQAPDVHEPVVLQQRTIKIQIFRNGQPWDVQLELVRDPAMPFYDTSSQTIDGREVIRVQVNLDHEFSVSFLNDNEAALQPLVRLIAALALGERLARISGVANAGVVRLNTNQLLSAFAKNAIN